MDRPLVDETQVAASCKNPPEGNPVFPLTGAKKEFVATGFSLGSVAWTLTYDTTTKLPANQSDTATLSEPLAFGPLWRSSFHRSLQVSSGLKTAMISRGDGSIVNFTGDGNGSFAPTGTSANRLVVNGDGFLFTDMSTRALELYDRLGRLTRMELVDGKVLTFTYTGTMLARVQEVVSGRDIQFTYDRNDLVTKVVGPGGVGIALSYDANRNLVKLAWPDGKSQGFLYENSSLPWALTGKVDENNGRYATFNYDAQGRAVVSEHANGVDRHEFAYGTPAQRTIVDTTDGVTGAVARAATWSAPDGILVTRPNGQVVPLTAQVINGAPALTGRSQPAGSGCGAATNAVSYDAKGNVLSRDDFQGARTCYAYDTSNREVTRVEGLPTGVSCGAVLPSTATLPTGARRVATSWHPDWALSVQTTEPLLQTTIVYQGQPDPSNGGTPANCTTAANRSDGKPLPLVCKIVQQVLTSSGTADASTPMRVTQFSYDPMGRPVSVVGPTQQARTLTYYTDATSTQQDALFSNVQLLMLGNGVNGSTGFSDASANAFAPTPVGTPTISSAQSKFGGGSIAFNGSTDALSFPHHFNLDLAGGDFTLETWAYINAFGSTRTILQKDQVYGVTNPSYMMAISANGALVCYVANGTNGSYSQAASSADGAISAGTWNHIACTRQGSTLKAFVNGNLAATVTLTGTPVDGGRPLVIGQFPQGSVNSWMNGYIDDLRITKGVARYTTSFAPPTAQLPSNGRDITAVGHLPGDLQSMAEPNGQVTQFAEYDSAGRVRKTIDPKGVTTQIAYTPRGWVASTITTPPGGSARVTSYTYDGVGQVTGVTLPDGSTRSYMYDAAHRLLAERDPRGVWVIHTMDAAGNGISDTTLDTAGATARTHFRSYDALNRIQQEGNVYLDSSAPEAHDASFANVQLLLHGNGLDGTRTFVDNSANGFVPTAIGSPVLRATPAKFGISSMYFSGNGDGLSFANNAKLNLAAGDFTIEAWVNVTSLTSGRTILQKDQVYGQTNPSYMVQISAAGALVCYVANGTNGSYSQALYSANGAIGIGAWNHVACTRQGSTLRAFVNGNLAATATLTGTPVDGGRPLVIGQFPQGSVNWWMAGYLDEVRLTKGVARYTANFTPPAFEFPNQGP